MLPYLVIIYLCRARFGLLLSLNDGIDPSIDDPRLFSVGFIHQQRMKCSLQRFILYIILQINKES